MRRRFLPEKIVAVTVLVGLLTTGMCLLEAQYRERGDSAVQEALRSGEAQFERVKDAFTGNQCQNALQQSPLGGGRWVYAPIPSGHGPFFVAELEAEAKPDVDAEELRAGLIATYHDKAKPAPVEITRLEPTIALALKASESPHPRLSADGGTVRWQGYVNVLRPGAYRFQALLRGKLRLTVGGKEVLVAEAKDATPALHQGPETKLDSGVQPLVAEFTRLPGEARLELSWQAPHFPLEPLPYDVLGHLPKEAPARLEADDLAEHGRFLAEERSCIKCHQPDGADRMAKTLQTRQGPDLSQIGQRAHVGWMYRWLESPQKVRPGAVMPQLFDDGDVGPVERYAVARYLASLGGPVPQNAKPPSPGDVRKSIASGEALFTSLGCIACHRENKTADKKDPEEKPAASFGLAPAVYPLTGLGSKTTPDKLAAYLINPLAVDLSGRMPHMLLQQKEAEDLARYLCQSKDDTIPAELPAAPAAEQVLAALQRIESRPEQVAAFQKLPAADQLRDLGARLVIAKGCVACHTVAPGGKPLALTAASASFTDIQKREKHEAGCLAAEPGKRGKGPWFALNDNDRKAVRAFLEEGMKGAGTPAPAHFARATLKRFNCLACHSRDGEGGLTPALVEELRRFEKVENAEAVMPPPLTGVGHKLRTPWVRQVLTQAGRARPWMGLRMPQFGDANVGKLPEALAALEGTEPSDDVRKVPLSAAKLDAGRFLAGKGAFGCISCHDLAGIPNSGTRGPDLAQMNQRVRYDWYRRWLEVPQRMQPGTRMPEVFHDGKSLVDKVLAGNPDAQAEALWAYFSLGNGLPLPDGMEPLKGLVLTVKDRPLLLRTFMPDAGSRAVAVGYPGGVSAAFDAATCRLAYAWSGNFLDASPVWNNRGGAPAKVLGPRFWAAPPGCPWDATNSAEPPDFVARSKDPAYGGPLPEGKLFDGIEQLRFAGYTVDDRGVPTFGYRIHAEATAAVEVSERPEPLRSPVAAGLARNFTVAVPAQQTPWLFAGEAVREPRLLDAKGATAPLDLASGTAEVPAAGRLLVLPQEGERLVVLAAAAAPEGSAWRLRREGSTWQALLHLPPAAKATKAEVRLNLWAPYRDDPALLKELLPQP